MYANLATYLGEGFEPTLKITEKCTEIRMQSGEEMNYFLCDVLLL